MVEERLVRGRGTITIGDSARNTFVLPASNLPRSTVLFHVRSGDCSLRLDDRMKGHVRLDEQGSVDVSALRRRGVAQRRTGGSWDVRLSKRSRGRILLGDTTVLFQFVAPRPPAPKVRLPAAVRGGWVKAIDWPLVAILALSATLQALPILWLVAQQWPEVRRHTIVSADTFLSVIPAVAPAPSPPLSPPSTEADTDPSTTPGPEPLTEPQAARKARRRATTKRQLAADVRDQSLLKHVTARGAGGSGRSLLDTLRGGTARAKLERAFDNAAGVTLAAPDQERSRPGGSIGEVVGIDDLGTTLTRRAVRPRLGKRETRVRGTVVTGTPPTTTHTGVGGGLPKDAISRVVKRRIRAVQACYERALKKERTLAGKLVVRFTIGTAGRVTSARVITNSTRSASVGSCVTGRISGWRFPRPRGGPVTVSYPFVFTPAG